MRTSSQRELEHALPVEPSLAGRLGARITAPVTRVELLVFCLVGVVLMMGRLAITHGPPLTNDSYQYLSVANNFRQGRPAQTSIVHFDVERSWGRVPAPMTTFPSGYPLAIAALSSLGLRPELAGTLISMLSALALLVLYALVDRAVGLGGLATRWLFVWTLASAQVEETSIAVASESLFTALTLGALLLFVGGVKERANSRRQWLWLVAANVLVGLSYWVRYAGLFCFASAAVYVSYLAWRHRDGTARRAAGSLLVSATLIGAGCLRNQLLVGTWKGGNTTPGRRHLVEMVPLIGASVDRIVLGDSGAPGVSAVDVLFLVAATALLVAGVRSLRRHRLAESQPRTDLWWLLVCYALVYSGCLTYVGLTSVISFGPRMFYPLLPVALLSGAMLIARLQRVQGKAQRRALMLGLALTTGAFSALNFRNYLVAPPPSSHQLAERTLAEEAGAGTSVRAWLDANVAKDEAVVANRGQATGYVLGRNTVSLISHVYSDQVWDEAAVQALMQRFGARVLVVYTDDRGDAAVTRESPFLSALGHGARPAWLTLAAQARDVLVFRRNQ